MFSLVALFAVVVMCASANTNPPVDSHEGIEPYCIERCPEGFDYIPSLGHCYKLLLELGPVSQDRGVLSCALNNGSALPAFTTRGQLQNLRKHFWEKNKKELSKSKASTPQAGFWTGYVRAAGDGVVSEDFFIDDYVNMYSGNEMPKLLWAKGQPNNDNLDQACVARKRFNKEFVQKTKKMTDAEAKKNNGLDDYQCSYPHWVICESRDVYALNKRAYNTKIMEGDQEAGGECELNWVEQSHYQFNMMIDGALDNNATHEAESYEAAEPGVTASVPRFEEICLPSFNYKCV